MDDANKVLQRLCETYRSGRGLALFFDYDGTLAPISPMPKEAVLPPAVRRDLKRLNAMTHVTVGVTSGRAIDDLKSMVALDGLYYAGTSGLEMDLHGRQRIPIDSNQLHAMLGHIVERLHLVSDGYPGAWIEQKPLGLTLHYRAVRKELVGQLHSDAIEALAPWQNDVRVDEVTLGIEIVPEVGRDKGTAIREILADRGGSPFPAYFGDAANDAPALVAMDELGGLSVGVGPVAPRAAMHLNGPEDVAALVEMLTTALADERQLESIRAAHGGFAE